MTNAEIVSTIVLRGLSLEERTKLALTCTSLSIDIETDFVPILAKNIDNKNNQQELLDKNTKFLSRGGSPQ